MPCSVCNHPHRQDIDLALLDRTATLTRLSRQYGLSTSALSRHKIHLKGKMAQAKSRFQASLREGYLFKLNKLLEKVWWAAGIAEAAGNSGQVLQAVRQITDILKFMAKLDDSFTAETVGRLLASPQWTEAGSLLPTDPQFVADCHKAMADSLFAPCPESTSDLETVLAVGLLEDAELAELAELHPELLRELSANLSQLPGSNGCSPDPARREKGGKKAGKATQRGDNYKKYKIDSKSVKSSGKSPRPEAAPSPNPEASRWRVTQNSGLGTQNLSRSGNWIEDLDAGRLNVDLLNAIAVGRCPDAALHQSSFR